MYRSRKYEWKLYNFVPDTCNSTRTMQGIVQSPRPRLFRKQHHKMTGNQGNNNNIDVVITDLIVMMLSVLMTATNHGTGVTKSPSISSVKPIQYKGRQQASDGVQSPPCIRCNDQISEAGLKHHIIQAGGDTCSSRYVQNVECIFENAHGPPRCAHRFTPCCHTILGYSIKCQVLNCG